MGDRDDEDVAAAWYSRSIWVVRTLVGGNELPFRQRHIALGTDGYDEMFPGGMVFVSDGVAAIIEDKDARQVWVRQAEPALAR